jgi:hypothetical protein
MPLHPNVRQCTHIKITGHRCGSPALKQEYFCYFHTRMIKGVQTRVDSQIEPIALIENAEAIQAALMYMIDAVLKGTIDNKRANIVLKALHIAVRNSRNVHFHICRHDMVREVPNYAQQYLTEHPELNPEPRGDSRLGCPAEQSSAGSTPTATKTSHPERARPSRESKDPDSTSRGKGAAGNSSHSPKRNHGEAKAQDVVPLTNPQSDHSDEIKKLEASIEGAMRGNWRDLRTVFNAIGLTPTKPLASQKVAPSTSTDTPRHEKNITPVQEACAADNTT